jgi:hypothetical protein
MSKGFGWCSTNLLDMPLASSKPTLRIEENGDVLGTWNVYGLNSIPDGKYIWKGTYPLIMAKLHLALVDKDKHVLLFEPEAMSITRGLLAKPMRNKEETLTKVQYKLVSSVNFHTSLTEPDVGEKTSLGLCFGGCQ